MVVYKLACVVAYARDYSKHHAIHHHCVGFRQRPACKWGEDIDRFLSYLLFGAVKYSSGEEDVRHKDTVARPVELKR